MLHSYILFTLVINNKFEIMRISVCSMGLKHYQKIVNKLLLFKCLKLHINGI